MISPGAAAPIRGTGVTVIGEPYDLRGRTLPSRVLFGPHVTNLADPSRPRAFSADHVAHYRARAAGGTGVVVVEAASVHASDHPYEYAPAVDRDGWAAIATACRPYGTAVLAGLGHAGAQGSSAYHRRALWAPSPVPDPSSREVPRAMGADDVAALVAGFADAAARAVAAGCDGVEVAAGQHALLRQFLSGLTNHRDDGYGTDRARLLVEVLTAVRAAVPDAVVGLRLAVDELAPWAGVTPGEAGAVLARVAGLVDLVTGVRGSGFSVGATRPDAHTPPGVLRATVRALRVPGAPATVLDGVVDPDHAAEVVHSGDADLVEMTRALLADPGLVEGVRTGRRARPCLLTNQRCLVRDTQNPRVGCTVEPTVGAVVAAPVVRHAGGAGSGRRPEVLVVGAGPAGLEAALTLGRAGVPVRVVEREARTGGLLRVAATLPGRGRLARLADFYDAELADVGVRVELGVEGDPGGDGPVLLAVGAQDRPGRGVPLARAVRDGVGAGPVVVDDPMGDGAAIAYAELLAAQGREVAVVTPDVLVGPGLAATGDLVDAQSRLARAGVRRVTESRVVAVAADEVVVADVVTGERTVLPAAVLVDGSPRRAPTGGAGGAGGLRIGDALAPRTVAEAVREGREAAEALVAARRGAPRGLAGVTG